MANLILYFDIYPLCEDLLKCKLNGNYFISMFAWQCFDSFTPQKERIKASTTLANFINREKVELK